MKHISQAQIDAKSELQKLKSSLGAELANGTKAMGVLQMRNSTQCKKEAKH